MANKIVRRPRKKAKPFSEPSYQRGQRQVWTALLAQAMAGLGMKGRTIESLICEREDVVAALRSLCAVHGDNDWTPELHLADVIEKHLARHLEEDFKP